MEEVSNTGSNGHQWQTQPRQHQIGAGTLVLHQHCVQCGREFLTDVTSRQSRAAFVGATSFYQLDDISNGTVVERILSHRTKFNPARGGVGQPSLRGCTLSTSGV